MKQGLTLIGTMVAVALSGIVAVIASEMATNQLTLAKIEELLDKRQAIFKFYTDLLDNEAVIQCTIGGNAGLKEYIKQYQTSSIITAAKLVPPSCSGSLIPASGMYLGESVSIPTANGWWKLDFSWEGKGRGTIDFIVDLCLDRSKYEAAYPSVTIPPLQWECPNQKTVRVRYSENSIYMGEKDCAPKAVVDIALHTANRQVTCSTHPLVTIRDCPEFIHKIDPSGNIVCAPNSRCGFDPTGASIPINKGISIFDCPNLNETTGYFLKLDQNCETVGGGPVIHEIAPPEVKCGTNRGYKGLRGRDARCPSGRQCTCPSGANPFHYDRDWCACQRGSHDICRKGCQPGGTC